MKHLDTDTLVGLGTALGWRREALEHVQECDTCRAAFTELEAVYAALVATAPLSPSQTAELVTVATSPSQATAGATRSYDWAPRVLTPLLAAAATVLVVLLQGG